jgi:hypothetical protein
MSETNTAATAATASSLERRFTLAKKVTKAANASTNNLGQTLGRVPPVQNTTNFQGKTNPASHVRVYPAASEQGNMRATSVMAFSMNSLFAHRANIAAKKPKGTNSNAAPPWLKTYGISPLPATNLPAEASQFSYGGTGPALLRNKNNSNSKVWRAS